ncbi:Cathepsin L [Oopsacas minuta]|uniref:Cathepsin L n=1 Tax=Oopsacas minuta TaxID=111878 RepID=A0AAV7K7D2_9METZ|nr:Cathepsin L [Oopsacas minuta]
MKCIILLALLVSFCAAYDLEEYTWIGFKKIHNKTYVGDEDRMRQIIFEDNLQYIEDHNNEGHSYTLGINQFADMTNLEYRQMMLGYDNEARISRPESTDTYHVCSMDTKDLPASVDWRTKGVVTPVKNQGQCGSCWSFSATGSLEGQYAMKNNKRLSFSEQQLVDCSTAEGNHGCQGGLMDFAFEYWKKYLEEQELDYPYKAMNMNCKYNASKGITKDQSYKDIKSKDIASLKDAIANVGPISVAMDASHTSFQLYKSGIYDPFFCSETRLDHGVLAVGYGTEDGKDYWLVKNSWTESWGDKGYFKIEVKGNKCGICTSASYPVL